jgi:hypothetical protein
MCRPEDPIETEAFTPEEMGWVRIAPRTWEMPDGKKYIFPPGGPEVIVKLVSRIPPYEGGK